MLESLQVLCGYYLLIGLVWSWTYTGTFLIHLIKNRQLQPIDSAIIGLIVLTFIVNFLGWPAGVYNTLKLTWKKGVSKWSSTDQ